MDHCWVVCDVLTLLLPFSNIILRLFRGKAGFSTGEVGENGSDAGLISSFSSAHFFCLFSMSAFVFAGLSWDVGSWLRLACRTGSLEEAGGSAGLLGLRDWAVRFTGATLSWGAALSWGVFSQRFFSTLRFPDRTDRGKLSTDWERVTEVNSFRHYFKHLCCILTTSYKAKELKTRIFWSLDMPRVPTLMQTFFFVCQVKTVSLIT